MFTKGWSVWLGAMLLPLLFAQSDPPGTVDGAINPEKIPDVVVPPALCIATAPRFWAGRISLFVLLLTLLSLLVVPAYLILLAIPPLALALTGVLYRSLERPAMSLSEPGEQDRCEFGRDIQALCLTPLWLPRRWNPAS